MRQGLIVLLSLGVLVGFGSGFARLAHRGGGCHERWGNRYDGPREGYGYGSGRYDRGERFDRAAAPVAAPAPAPAPAAVAPAPAAAPVYLVIPSAAAQAPIVVNNAPAPVAAPAANPQPAPAAQ